MATDGTFTISTPTVEEILQKAGTDPQKSVNNVSRRSQYGSLDDVIARSFYGINHRQQPLPVTINKDYFGLTFFTRPELNLSTENLRTVRKLTPLLNKDETSIHRIIRCLLDPRLADNTAGRPAITSPLVDNKQAFIPILTNNLLSISGWPDTVIPMYQSEPGAYGEVFMMADGISDVYSAYDIQANFRNLPSDPITMMFYYWVTYMSAVFEGLIIPYPEKMMENEIDYQTRVYRLILDSTKTYVRKIGACGASCPASAPTGAGLNYESGRPINDSNDQVSMTLHAVGAMTMDDILIKEFNDCVVQANPMMADTLRTAGKNAYVQIPTLALELFNTQGYPRIDLKTRELQWWLPKNIFDSLLPDVNAISTQLGVPKNGQ